MKVKVKETTLVKPMEETPSGSLWLSNLDTIFPIAYYSRLVFFYRFNGAPNFFDAAVIKAALSKALVTFYPYAGRLRKGDNGRYEIDCNAEGAVFLLADCDATLDELGGFAPRDDVPLLADVDSSLPMPPCLLQLTRFRCGGVCMGFVSNHHVADGPAVLHYIKTCSDLARGLTPTTRPFLDRRLLRARNPPHPHYPHIEYQLPPSLNISLDMSQTSFKMFGFSRHQITALLWKCNHHDDQGDEIMSYTRYEAIAGHVWRSVCMARRLPHDQESMLRFPVDGRWRLSPPLPPHFFGNAMSYTRAVASCGEIMGNPLSFTVEKVHQAVVQMNDDYMRSAVDHLELEMPKSRCVVRNLSCPNFGITNWINLPFYEMDYGWGRPVFAGPGKALLEGKSFVFADPLNEGGVLFQITLLKQHMEIFQKIIYDI